MQCAERAPEGTGELSAEIMNLEGRYQNFLCENNELDREELRAIPRILI